MRLLSFGDNRQVPRFQLHALPLSHRITGQEIRSVAVGIGEGLLLSGEIQIVVQQLPLCVAAVSNLHRRRKVLIRPSQAGAFQDIANDLALQGVRQKSAFVGQCAAAKFVPCDRGEGPVRIVERSDNFGSIRYQELFPYSTFVLVTYSIWIWCEPLRFSQVCKFLIMETGCGMQRSGRHDGSYSRILIREPALECHYDLAAVLDMTRKLLQHLIGRAVEWRYEQDFVPRKLRVSCLHEIRLDI